MIKRSILAIASFTIVTALSSAHAVFTGVWCHTYHVNAVDGFGAPDFNGYVCEVWVESNNPNDSLSHIYNFNDVNLGITYYQSFTGGTWLPNNLGPPFETPALQYADSYVSIGGYNGGSQPGADGTGLDPLFGGTGAPGPGENGGWYNSDSGNPIGAVVQTEYTSTGLGVFIGRFAINSEEPFTLAGSRISGLGGGWGECKWGNCDFENFIIKSLNCKLNSELCACRYDLNYDGTVDAGDLGLILAAWGPCPDGCIEDFNNDGIVDGGDLGLILGFWDDCVW